jgi:thiamine transport system ATP-binding protein
MTLYMSKLIITDLSKSFERVRAVWKMEFALEAGELLALVGPSGCGKTTTLRLIAGFDQPDTGKIILQGRDLSNTPPEKRRIGFVFQNYALFPHMTVAQNIAYGIRFSSSYRTRVQELIQLVDLSGLEHRYPKELSSGQCQRVALARALAPHPDLLLLDEPLSALDAKLREALRREIRNIQQELKLGTVYVTHDQEEAMAIADRIAVMNAGQIEQIGTPPQIYSYPSTVFVASFIGHSNMIQGIVTSVDNLLLEIGVEGGTVSAITSAQDFRPGDKVVIFYKEEDLRLSSYGENTLLATVSLTEYHGQTMIIHLKSPIGLLRARIPANAAIHMAPGMQISVSLPAKECLIFPQNDRV